VKSDPGVWWVYAGFILVFPGLYLAFFRPAARWAVVLEGEAKGGSKVRLLGASPRNREEFAASLERLLAGFEKETPP
jgi:cytochrome c biogenesis protein